MVASIYVMPVRPGRSDDFQAFVAELMGTRRVEWAQSQRRRGVKRQVVFLGKDGSRIWRWCIPSPTTRMAFRAIAASEDPFDRWLAGKMSELLEARIVVDTLADTAPKPGPWRGWRRWR